MNQREAFVRKTFDDIARRYDLLNRVISFHLDTKWRRNAVAELQLRGKRCRVLDLGTGTGDLALTTARQIGQAGTVIGLDVSAEMIRLAAKKTHAAALGQRVRYFVGSALAPPFKDASFDGITTAFVLRNVSDLHTFFGNSYQLLKPGGRLVSLEMFPPQAPFSYLYSIYFYGLVPWIGARLAHNRQAYRYLADSVKTFCAPERVTELLQESGFGDVKTVKYLCGAVCLHCAEKPRNQSIR